VASSADGRYSTVRPVKKVDAAGSQRISNEFIGTGSVRRHPDANGTSRAGLESPLKTRQPLSAKGRAGQALVEEVVLGVLDSVGFTSGYPKAPVDLRLLVPTWMRPAWRRSIRCARALPTWVRPTLSSRTSSSWISLAASDRKLRRL